MKRLVFVLCLAAGCATQPAVAPPAVDPSTYASLPLVESVKPIDRVEPHIPPSVLHQGFTSSKLSFVVVIAEDGSVRDAWLTGGDERLAGAFRQAALQWRFEPVIIDGRRAAARYASSITITAHRVVP